MKSVVLFDQGGTLVQYYNMTDFPGVLCQSMAQCAHVAGHEPDWERVKSEDFEAKDYCVRPLEDRLRRIFQVADADWSDETALVLSRAWLTPVFARARVYDDVLPTLGALREAGVRTAIVSNTPWGSPAAPWREEIARLGLADAVDQTVFCRDCGWRKPARPVFDHTLNALGATPDRCLFVGDDPGWDIAGPEAIGMDALLIDRAGHTPDALHSLRDLPQRLAQ